MLWWPRGQRDAEVSGAAEWLGSPGCWLNVWVKVGCSDGGTAVPVRTTGTCQGPSFLTPVGHFPSVKWGKLRHKALQGGQAARAAAHGSALPLAFPQLLLTQHPNPGWFPKD